VQLRETSGFVGCPFCGTSLVLDLTGVRPHLLYRPRQKAADVLPLLRRWCDAQGLPPPSGLSAAQLTYRPFWRYVSRGHPRLIAAWPALEARWGEVEVPTAEQAIYDPAGLAGSRVVEPSVAEAAARRRVFGEDAAAVEAGDLVHVPFFEGQVAMGPHRMHVSVEACAGRVYADRIPQVVRDSGTRRTFGATALSLGFLALFLEAMLVPPLWLAVVAVAMTGVVLYWAVVGGN
jgi:hypothetical protein